MSSLAGPDLELLVERERERRSAHGTSFFDLHAERIAALCHLMAERFARGGRLLALGADPVARSDARHVAVEFVHPVIVGKRALPALALTAEGGAVDAQLARQLGDHDVVIGFGGERDEASRRALEHAREHGALTVSFPAAVPSTDAPTGRAATGSLAVAPPAPRPIADAPFVDAALRSLAVAPPASVAAEWAFVTPGRDERIDQELVETTYHVLWELVHVFFEHRGLLAGRSERLVHDSGASSFLYPFLAEQEHDLDAVIADVRASALAKAADALRLREQTLSENAAPLAAAAAGLRERFAAGGRLLALGNGGSATDAMDLVADLAAAGRPALDLTEDAGIITAVGNDIGIEAIFSRQVIAHGGDGDALVALSTSGGSANVLHALAEARRRGLLSIAFVGYDGGRIAAESLADHVIVTRAEHIPRIQEAQASAYHALCELVELGAEG